jgi:membrane-associated PAP2 superfamily phosphatase
MIGCVTKFLSGQVVGGLPKIVAAVSGFVIMLLFLKIAEKKPKFGEFALGLAMLLALFIAQAVRVMGG